MKKILFTFIIILLSSFNYGQEKYLIYFKDKGIKQDAALNKTTALYQEALNNLTERAVERRKKNMGEEIINYDDLPISENYINELRSLGVEIVHKLTWFNSVSAFIKENQLIDVQSLPFVVKVEPVKKIKFKKREIPGSDLEKKPGSSSGYNYGLSFGQLNLSDIPVVHSRGITGEGVIIGLLDTGFDWMNHESLLNTNVIAEYDFIFKDDIADDQPQYHGSQVLSTVGGFKDSTLIGAAFGSSFLLAKTEDVRSETHIEEDNYAAALIWMETLGVDVTSSSLGYSEFDDSTFSYTYEDMDGKTTIVTQACEMAFDRGVVTITSAGNEGSSPWFYITAPADGFNTIAVGAVTSNNIVTSFSSRGPSFDGRIKPDILAQGQGVYAAIPFGFSSYNPGFSGTSAAGPIACGAAALLLSAHPHLTNVQVRSILLETADNAAEPNNERGYGLVSAAGVVNFPNLEADGSQYRLHKIFVDYPNINPVSAKIFYATDTVNFIEESLTFDGQLKYNFDFPAFQTNQIVHFYFTFQDSTGTNFREPEDENYQFAYGQLAISLRMPEIIVPETKEDIFAYPNPFHYNKIYANDCNCVKILVDSKEKSEADFNVYTSAMEMVYSSKIPFDITGKVLEWKEIRNLQLASGVYIYVTRIGDETLAGKLVIFNE